MGWWSREELEQVVRTEIAKSLPRVDVVYRREDAGVRTHQSAGVFPMKRVPSVGQHIYTPDGKFGTVRAVDIFVGDKYYDDAAVIVDLFQ